MPTYCSPAGWSGTVHPGQLPAFIKDYLEEGGFKPIIERDLRNFQDADNSPLKTGPKNGG